MKKIIIVAASENGVIGVNNNLPWRLPDDMKMFKETTTSHCVIMGRKNWESIPHKYKPLPDRLNVILSRDMGYIRDLYGQKDVAGSNSLASAYYIGERHGYNTCYIIGGGEIYKEAIKDGVDEILLTRVHTEVEGDVFFELPFGYTLTSEEYHPVDEKHKFAFTFLKYEKD